MTQRHIHANIRFYIKSPKITDCDCQSPTENSARQWAWPTLASAHTVSAASTHLLAGSRERDGRHLRLNRH